MIKQINTYLYAEEDHTINSFQCDIYYDLSISIYIDGFEVDTKQVSKKDYAPINTAIVRHICMNLLYIKR